MVMISPKGNKMSYMLQLHFMVSNNVAEYEALLHGLHIAILMGLHRLLVRGDSNLIIQQVMKAWDMKDPRMMAYCTVVCRLEGHYNSLEVHHIKCTDNTVANTLARVGAFRELLPLDIFIEHLHQPSIKVWSQTWSQIQNPGAQ